MRWPGCDTAQTVPVKQVNAHSSHLLPISVAVGVLTTEVGEQCQSKCERTYLAGANHVAKRSDISTRWFCMNSA